MTPVPTYLTFFLHMPTSHLPTSPYSLWIYFLASLGLHLPGHKACDVVGELAGPCSLAPVDGYPPSISWLNRDQAIGAAGVDVSTVVWVQPTCLEGK